MTVTALLAWLPFGSEAMQKRLGFSHAAVPATLHLQQHGNEFAESASTQLTQT